MIARPPMSEAVRREPLDDGLRDGVEASQPRLAAARVDSRLSRLYREEQRPLSIRDAASLMIKSWPFIHPHRRLLTIKFALALSSLTFFLLTPWPMKIVVDNVINGHPMT